ncbi:carbohydrate esterase family 16 protein [Wolfiporia cocos MD-104 SS10]|uniref:Carbohydrate esterase family 16 protein n=1 Tax=Wolfiporia cocos (strain MD-104) TaxID=742152 RepID=A0A2H3J8N9_WOLCO|nr:carbohydrate esterase family 16 protein [Wolfiporia cocos MD-104 SS10]
MSSRPIRPSWKGFSNISYLVIFGDSYCDVGYELYSPYPTQEEPFGVAFPGKTYTEPETPNWVGHLVTEYTHQPVLVYDYAHGGDGVDEVCEQINYKFIPGVAAKPKWAPWQSTDTLFICWIGINDCASESGEAIREDVKRLFTEQERLYKVGARNFLFIDVPPIHRSPIGLALQAAGQGGSFTYEVWNSQLKESIAQFSAAHSDATIFLFSSWDTFNRVLDNPVAHGFTPKDPVKKWGGIWYDHLHPTSRMHDWIAHDLADFLNAQPPHQEDE